jgi:hypothetical protein
MKQVWTRYSCGIVLIIYVALFFGIKKPGVEWDRVINSDGKAYYAYLPAIFIYHDLQFNFVESYESGYYPRDRSAYKEFRMPYDGRIVNKGFPGLALLWVPFFLVAHVLSLILGFPADGYSTLYQYLIAFSALFYLWLGCRMLRKLLLLNGASLDFAAFIPVLIALGTNIIYYTINEGTMPHVYNFALVAGLALSVTMLFREYRRKWLILSTLLFGLIVIVRPVNGLFVLTLPFWAGNPTNFKKTISLLFRDTKGIIESSISLLLVLAIPVILWYLQTGHAFVYSYGDEHFIFTRPETGKLLFSYEKGWLVYTPLAVLGFLGLIPIYRQSKTGFASLLVFWLVFIYISSCWWVWDYTSRFSQRIFIDFYGILAIMLLFAFEALRPMKLVFRVGMMGILLVIVLNLMQYYQSWKWVYPQGPVNREIYWDYFFQMKPLARIAYPNGEDVQREVTFSNDMEKAIGWINEDSYTAGRAHSGLFSSLTGGSDSVGTGVDKLIKPYLEGPRGKVIISAWVFSGQNNPGASLILDFNSEGLSFDYHTFSLDRYIRRNKWTYVEFMADIPRLITDHDRFKVYALNSSEKDSVHFDDMSIRLLSLKESNEPVPAIVSLQGSVIEQERIFFNDMESDTSGPGAGSISEGMAMTGKRSSRIDRVHPYSAGLRKNIRSVTEGSICKIQVSAFVHTDSDTSRSTLVADFNDPIGTFLYVPVALDPYLKRNEWIFVEILIDVPYDISDKDDVLIYFWNPSESETVHIDDLTVNFISLKENAMANGWSRHAVKDIAGIESRFNDMESDHGWKNSQGLTSEFALFGKRSCRIDSHQPFSISLQVPVNGYIEKTGRINVSAYVYSTVSHSATTLVVDFRNEAGSYLYVPCYMNGRSRFMEWEYIECTVDVPPARLDNDQVSVYFWNPSQEEVFYIDHLRVDFIDTKPRD